MKKLLFVLVVCYLWPIEPIIAQSSTVDSLIKVIRTSRDDEKKIKSILELANQAVNPDTLLPFAKEAIELATKANNKDWLHKARFAMIGYYARKNITDSALLLVDPLLADLKKDQTKSDLYLSALFFKAKILDRSNQYTKSLSQLVEVVELAEELKDTLTMIQGMTGIGWVQMEMDQYQEALYWLYKAKSASNNPKFYNNYGALYSNIASAYNSLHKYDSARHYIEIAISDARKNNNLVFLATALSMQAKIFTDNNQQQLAEQPLNEVLNIRKKLNDPFYLVFDMSSLASYYARTGQTDKGIALCLEGIELAKHSGLSSQLLMIYRALAENYKAAGNNSAYSHTLEGIISLKDSFSHLNSSKQVSELMAANETQKRQNQIREQELRLTIKNYWLVGSALFLLMATVIGLLAFSNYSRKQQLKMQLALEEEKRQAAIAVVHAEEQERKRIAADLHDSLGAYAASIASNIDHLNSSNNEKFAQPLQELRTNSQAMVAQLGDTIWALKKDELSMTDISDRLKVFVRRIGPSYPSIRFDVSESIVEDAVLPPSQAFHLFQIVQEAVINALRHSDGNQIQINIDQDDSWSVTISDNGSGMKPFVANGIGGNGLANMKDRAEAAGWSIEWTKNDLGGTSVIVSPTTN